MNWDDLRYFLAIARARSLTAAARDLGVSQPTVSRRLATMEARLGVRLFERGQNGYELSAPGVEIFERVQTVEEELNGIDRQLFGRDRRLTGSLRITCTEALANLYLAPHLSAFTAGHPDIDLSLHCGFQRLSLSRREADVAIRFTRRPPETLVGRRLARAAFAVYGGADAPVTGARESWQWIGWQDEAYTQMMIAEPFPGSVVRHRVDGMQTMAAMARVGLGVAVLPCYLADPDPGLKRLIPEPLIEATPDLWLLTHPDVRRVARVRRFSDYMADAFAADRRLFEGRRDAPSP